MGSRIRVVLVDDSMLARDVLRDILESDGGFDIIGEADNGQKAVDLAVRLRPDLMTMDLEMPVMDGLAAIGEIMARRAVPILVVSGVADAQNAYDAIAHGALDVVVKPGLDAADARAFVDKARLVAGVRVITHVRRPPGSMTGIPAAPSLAAGPGLGPEIAPFAAGIASGLAFAIASSTGGPQALAVLLQGLSADFGAPILIAQHISDGFAPGMAEWLNSLSPLPVRLGQEGMGIEAGTVYLSPSEANLALTPARRLTLVPRQNGDIYHPTCDILLASVAAHYGRRAVGIILTGMGRDGTRGMQAIRQAGGQTVAQDEASSVIYGMNQVAVASGCIQDILPLDRIAPHMAELCRRSRNTGAKT